MVGQYLRTYINDNHISQVILRDGKLEWILCLYVIKVVLHVASEMREKLARAPERA